MALTKHFTLELPVRQSRLAACGTLTVPPAFSGLNGAAGLAEVVSQAARLLPEEPAQLRERAIQVINKLKPYK